MTYQPVPQRSAKYTATSGFTMTIADGITLQVISAAGLLAMGTIIFPANPVDGQPLTINCPKGVTLLTISANTGQSISNNFLPTVLAANTPFRAKYSQVDSTWYPN